MLVASEDLPEDVASGADNCRTYADNKISPARNMPKMGGHGRSKVARKARIVEIQGAIPPLTERPGRETAQSVAHYVEDVLRCVVRQF